MKNLQFAFAAVVAFLVAATSALAGSASLVLDARTGKILAAENADTPNYPASLTKMMTLYLTFEALHRGQVGWETTVPMSREAARKPPTRLGLKAGDAITVREAVYGMIIHSANDAAAAVAEKLGGSEPAFAQMMTAKARRLGMTRTVFVNASGLPASQQMTTARDMATLAVALMRDFPQEYRLFSTRSFKFRGRTIRGHNNLMYRYNGMDGIKTGYTNASGFNLVSAVQDGNRRIIGVVLGGRTARSRDNRMAALLDQHLGRAAQANVAAAAPRGAVAIATLPGVSLPYAAPPRPTEDAVAAVIAASAESAVETEELAATPSRPAIGLWQIQVSAAPTEEGARRILAKARSVAAGALAKASPTTEAVGKGANRFYRARFVGFASREAAAAACARLKKQAYDCVLLPGRG